MKSFVSNLAGSSKSEKDELAYFKNLPQELYKYLQSKGFLDQNKQQFKIKQKAAGYLFATIQLDEENSGDKKVRDMVNVAIFYLEESSGKAAKLNRVFSKQAWYMDSVTDETDCDYLLGHIKSFPHTKSTVKASQEITEEKVQALIATLDQIFIHPKVEPELTPVRKLK